MSVPVVSYRRREEKSRGGDGLYGAIAVTALPLVGVLASNRQVVFRTLESSRSCLYTRSLYVFPFRLIVSIQKFWVAMAGDYCSPRAVGCNFLLHSLQATIRCTGRRRASVVAVGDYTEWIRLNYRYIECIFNKSLASIPSAVSWYCRTARVQVVELIIFNDIICIHV